MHIAFITRETAGGHSTYRAYLLDNRGDYGGRTCRIHLDDDSDIDVGTSMYALVASRKKPSASYYLHYTVIERVSDEAGREYLEKNADVEKAYKALCTATKHIEAGKLKSPAIKTVRELALNMPFFKAEAEEILEAIAEKQKEMEPA